MTLQKNCTWREISPYIKFGLSTNFRALFKDVKENKHGEIIITSEFDDFLNSMHGEPGRCLSNLLRTAFHHEEVTKTTVCDDYGEIEKPRLAFLASGTPGQLGKLFKSQAENGLMTRFCYYKTYPESIKEEDDPMEVKIFEDGMAEKIAAFANNTFLKMQEIPYPVSMDMENEAEKYFRCFCKFNRRSMLNFSVFYRPHALTFNSISCPH